MRVIKIHLHPACSALSRPIAAFLDTCTGTKGDERVPGLCPEGQVCPHCPGPSCSVQVLPLWEGAERRDKLLPPANRREPSATARDHLRMAVAKCWSICLRDEPPQMDTQMFLLFPAGFKEEHVQ